MKILKSAFRVSLASLILLSNRAAGQNKFIENSFPVKNTTHATAIPGGWVVPMNSSDCSRSWIVKFNGTTGNFTKYSEADSIGAPSFVITDILRVSSDELICAGMSGLGNDVGSLIYPYIFKIDGSGKIIWQAVFADRHHISLGEGLFTKVITSQDGSIYAITDEHFIGKTDSTGHIIWMKSIAGINDIALTAKGLLGVGDSIVLLDTGSNILKNFPLPVGFKASKLEVGLNNILFATDSNHIYRLDSNFLVVDSFSFTGYTSNAIYTVVNHVGDSAYYFAQGNSVKAFDLKGNLKWTNYLPSDCNITGLSTNGDQLAVTGLTGASAFIKTYDINGNTAPINRDVEIVKLNPVKVSMHPSSGIYFYTVSVKMAVTLQNKGSETIDSVYLYSAGPLASPYYSCSDELLQSFHHLNLAPGDDTTLNISFNRTWEAPPGSSYDLNVTMYATAPNGKLNLSETNNAAKYSQTVLSINEKLSENQSINIYPNPATNMLHIDNNTGLNTSISVSGITGKEITSITNPKNEFELDISVWPAGIYFVKAWNENGMQVEKIVKE